jgi:hypothetical protein
MFDPSKQGEKKAKKKAIKQVREWVAELIPIDKQDGLNINVEEVQCGDPVRLTMQLYIISYMLIELCSN